MAIFDLFSSATQKADEVAKFNALKKGKTPEQQRVIDFFYDAGAGGCFSKSASTYTFAEYQKLVLDKCKSFNFEKLAFEKIGLDESQVQEIPPVFLSSFHFTDDCRIKVQSNQAVSNLYSVTVIYFSATQLYTYQFIFDMMSDNTWEYTNDYFYSDITCFSTTKQVKEKIDVDLISGCFKKGTEKITKNNYVIDKLEIVVPGSTFSFSMRNSDTVDQSIQAAKAMIREKKHAI